MKQSSMFFLLTGIFFLMLSPIPAVSESTQEQVQQLDDVVVKEKKAAPKVLEQTPAETVIRVQELPTVGVPASIADVLKRHAIIDFRGESEADAGVDSVYMRGFDATRFVTAIEGLTLQKTGGRKSSNIVDYSLLPAFLIDSVEILPGPHSALFDSKSIGGVVNMKMKKPETRETLIPEGQLTASYSSYNTQTDNLIVQGAVKLFTYDLAYQKSSTSGYLRNNASDNDTVFGRFGLILPSDGFVTLSASYSDVDREAPVTNIGSDYDPTYPEVESAAFEPWQQPVWDGVSYSYRLNYEQDSPAGRLSLGAYFSKDTRDRSYYATANALTPAHSDTNWWQEGGKIQDEIKWSDKHITTIGFDLAKLYDNGVESLKTERVDKKGTFLQHQWGILPSLDLRMGLRYEDVGIKVTNFGVITGREDIISRDWDQLIPKSFLTWKMDQMAPWLQDTSLSLGVSKIWRAPDTHGDYNPQGRPAGAWLEPEHGMGYDLVLNRRIWGDIGLKVNYAFYQIKDYIASNSSYAKYSGANAGSLRYSDYSINLEEVYRHGVDLELGGHLTDKLSFYLTYAWQKFDNQGDEPAGETELDNRAEHRVTAGLSYQLFEKTSLMLDYYYQSDEITEVSEEIEPDVWYFTEEENPAHHVFDFAVQQVLFQSDRHIKDVKLKLYVKNLFDEKYKNASGYPATDRTFGASLSLKF